MEGVPVRRLTKVIRKRTILKGKLSFLSFIPMTDPWDWYIHLHAWLIFMVNVGEHPIYMDPMAYIYNHQFSGDILVFRGHFWANYSDQTAGWSPQMVVFSKGILPNTALH